MRHYLYKAIFCWIIAIYLSTFIGCATSSWQSKCGDNTLLAISTVGSEYPVRGVLGNVANGEQKGALHIQAEYFKDGRWRPLQVIKWPVVWEGEQEFKLINIEYLTGAEVLERYQRIFRDRAERY